MTAATVAHLAVMRDAGRAAGDRSPTSSWARAEIAWLERERAADPELEVYCLVDSVAGVRGARRRACERRCAC